MKKFAIMLSAGALACAGVATAQADSEANSEPMAFEPFPEFAPVIGFMEPRADLGTIEKGEKIEHAFDFLNNGNAPLTLLSARSPNSGVSVSISSAPVPAGEHGKVWVKINTAQLERADLIKVYLHSDAHNGDSILYVMMDLTEAEAEAEAQTDVD